MQPTLIHTLHNYMELPLNMLLPTPFSHFVSKNPNMFKYVLHYLFTFYDPRNSNIITVCYSVLHFSSPGPGVPAAPSLHMLLFFLS